MNRRRADVVVSLLVGTVLLVGGALSWQAYQRRRTLDGMNSMMGPMMGSVHGTDPLWYVLGTLLGSVVVGGLYLVVRDDVTDAEASDRPTDESPSARGEAAASTGSAEHRDEAVDPAEQPRSRVLDLLPEDERRILEPVLSSPGITQIELRDRSDFSKSKVSQTVSDLEKRGLLYRERQGRTYRVYPSDELHRDQL